MARAMTAGELTNIRKDNQFADVYLASIMPATVGTAQVSAAPSDDDEVTSVSLKSWSWGSGYTSVPADFLVYVGSSAGAYDKGMVRLRDGLSGTPSSMNIGEISEIEWNVDDHITIVEEIPLAAKHLFIDSGGTVYQDFDNAYSDQHSNPDPVPVLGPTIVPVWMTGASIDTDWDASDSWVLTGSITAYSWSAPGASGTADMSTSTPVITYDTAGTYRVSCTVTASGGATYTGYRWVCVFTDASPPLKVTTLETCSGAWDQGGWYARVAMHEDVDVSTDIRNRGLVCLFTKDWYGGTEGSQGPITDRENVLMIGWVANETLSQDPEESSVTLEIQGPHYWYQQMQGFPTGMESVSGTPAAWTSMQTLTLRKGLWSMFNHRTTTTRILDLALTSSTTEIALFNAAPGTLWEQLVSESENTLMAKPCCDRFGRVYVEKEPNIVPAGDRGSIPTVLTITTEDVQPPIGLERRTVPTTGLVDLSGVVYDVSTDTGSAKFSLSPGHIPKWHGPNVERRDRLALESQSQSNNLAGLLMGWRNAAYPSVTFSFGCNMRMIDVCPHQYVSYTLSSGDTPRGVSATLTLVPRSVSFSWDDSSGVLLADVQCEESTSKVGGIDGDVPSEPPDPGPAPLPDIPAIPEPTFAPGWPTHVIAFTRGDSGESTVGNVYESTDFTGPGGAMPTWTKKAGTGLPATRYFTKGGADWGDPENDLYVWTTGDDLYGSRDGGATFSLLLEDSDINGITGLNGTIHDFAVDPENTGHIYVCWKGTELAGWDATWGVVKSTDYGSSWAVAGANHGGSGWTNLVQYIKVTTSDIWLGGNWARRPRWQVSHNGGSSFTEGPILGDSIWAPYVHWNEVASSVWLNEGGNSFGTDLAKSTSDTTYTRVRDSDDLPPRDSHSAMYISVNDADRMWLVYGNVIYYTDDAWSSMTTGSSLGWETDVIGWCGDGDANDDYKRMILCNDDAGNDAFEDEESVYVTDDWGTTLENKSGTNYNTGPGYTDAIPCIDGGVTNLVVVDRDAYR